MSDPFDKSDKPIDNSGKPSDGTTKPSDQNAGNLADAGGTDKGERGGKADSSASRTDGTLNSRPIFSDKNDMSGIKPAGSSEHGGKAHEQRQEQLKKDAGKSEDDGLNKIDIQFSTARSNTSFTYPLGQQPIS